MATTREKARKSGKGARRAVAPRAVYERPMGDQRIGWEDFRFVLVRRKRKLSTESLDGLVTAATWVSGERVTEMTVGMQLPPASDRERGGTAGAGLVAAGDTVRCEVDTNGNGVGWRGVWEAVVQDPVTHTLADGSLGLTLKPAQGDGLTEQRVAWKFRKDRAHPAGWTADKVTRFAAQRFRVKIGTLARGTHRIDRLVEKKASVRAVVERAYKMEREATGRRFVIEWVGALNVREVREPEYMRVLGPLIVQATVERSLKKVYSAAIVTGNRKVAGRSSRYSVKVVQGPRLEKYGYLVKTITKNGLTPAQARAHGRNLIARAWRSLETVTITHPGIPWVQKGDATRIELPDDGIEQLAYVRQVSHDLSPAGYDMELEVAYADPWEDARKARAKAKAAAARKKRKRVADGREVSKRVRSAKGERRS